MKIIIISGPTASGKSGLALDIAKKVRGIVINADSMQIYQDLPVLSAQPTLEEQSEAPHALYNVISPYENCSVGKWLNLVNNVLSEAEQKNLVPIMVGGTGMYITKLVDGVSTIPDINETVRKEANELFHILGNESFYSKIKKIDPEYAAKINSGDKQRMTRVYEVFKQTGKNMTQWHAEPTKRIRDDMDFFHINFDPDRDWLYARCNKRFKMMVDQMDAVEEVQSFLKQYPDIMNEKHGVYSTLGFIEIYNHLKGIMTYKEMIDSASQKTRNYAKRQYTWFRNQVKDKYLLDENYDSSEVISKVEAFLKG